MPSRRHCLVCKKEIHLGRKLCAECRWRKKREYSRILTAQGKQKGKRILSQYGLTEQDYLIMHIKQEFRCAICKKPPGKAGLFVDHDHTTGKVRELLCITCNTFLGRLESDRDLTNRVLNYMLKWQQAPQKLAEK